MPRARRLHGDIVRKLADRFADARRSRRRRHGCVALGAATEGQAPERDVERREPATRPRGHVGRYGRAASRPPLGEQLAARAEDVPVRADERTEVSDDGAPGRARDLSHDDPVELAQDPPRGRVLDDRPPAVADAVVRLELADPRRRGRGSVVDRDRSRRVPAFVSRAPCAKAEVDVLVVCEEARVEAAEVAERAGAPEAGGARRAEDLLLVVVPTGVEPALPAAVRFERPRHRVSGAVAARGCRSRHDTIARIHDGSRRTSSFRKARKSPAATAAPAFAPPAKPRFSPVRTMRAAEAGGGRSRVAAAGELSTTIVSKSRSSWRSRDRRQSARHDEPASVGTTTETSGAPASRTAPLTGGRRGGPAGASAGAAARRRSSSATGPSGAREAERTRPRSRRRPTGTRRRTAARSPRR